MQKKGTLSIATLKFDHVVWFYHGMCPVMTNYNNPELVLSKSESPNLIFCRLEISHIFSRLDIQRQQYSCTITTQIINKQTLSSRFIILCRCSDTKYNYSDHQQTNITLHEQQEIESMAYTMLRTQSEMNHCTVNPWPLANKLTFYIQVNKLCDSSIFSMVSTAISWEVSPWDNMVS